MPNTYAPFGFRQFRRLDGGAPTAGFDTLTIASSDTNQYFTGDPVSDSTAGPYVTVPSSATIRGIFMGCEFYSPTFQRKVWSPYFPGSVQTSSGTADAQAWVCTDPEMLYIVQGSTTNVIPSSNINSNFMVMIATSSLGNTTTGISAVALGSSTVTLNASGQFRLYDFYSNWAPPGVNGTDNTVGGQIVIVSPNNFSRNNTTAL